VEIFWTRRETLPEPRTVLRSHRAYRNRQGATARCSWPSWSTDEIQPAGAHNSPAPSLGQW